MTSPDSGKSECGITIDWTSGVGTAAPFTLTICWQAGCFGAEVVSAGALEMFPSLVKG